MIALNFNFALRLCFSARSVLIPGHLIISRIILIVVAGRLLLTSSRCVEGRVLLNTLQCTAQLPQSITCPKNHSAGRKCCIVHLGKLIKNKKLRFSDSFQYATLIEIFVLTSANFVLSILLSCFLCPDIFIHILKYNFLIFNNLYKPILFFL